MEQFKVSIPENKRVSGWLYDFSSGCLMGIASDEMKKKNTVNTPINITVSGCPHKVVIWP